jgi:hypothetical protein
MMSTITSAPDDILSSVATGVVDVAGVDGVADAFREGTAPAKSRMKVLTYFRMGDAHCASFSNNGRWLLVAGGTHVQMWDLDTGGTVLNTQGGVNLPDKVLCCAISRENLIAYGGADWAVRTQDFQACMPVQVVQKRTIKGFTFDSANGPRNSPPAGHPPPPPPGAPRSPNRPPPSWLEGDRVRVTLGGNQMGNEVRIHSLYTHYTLTIHSLYTHYTLTIHSLCTHYTLIIGDD